MIRVQPLAIPQVYPRTTDATEAWKRREIFRHVRGCGRWLEAKLPDCIVTETIGQQADGWVIELTVRPRTEKEDGQQVVDEKKATEEEV